MSSNSKLKIPEVLYKYRSWVSENHKRLLTHNEIYYAAPNEFGEITECNLERDYESISEQNIWDFCMNEAMRLVDEGKVSVSSVNNKAQELYKSNTFHDLENRKKTEADFNKYMNKVLSIFSASEISTNERLWDSFADLGRGYCVGIDFTEIYNNQSIFGTAGWVDYYDEDNPPKVPPFCLTKGERIQKMMKIMYSLPNKFKKEAEFRLTKMHITNRVVSIKAEWIKEIILGENIDSISKQEILDIVKNKYPHVKIKKIYREPTFNIISSVDI